MPKVTRIRWWFIVLLPLLAAQFYFARRVSEPYPAIIFPSFSTVPVHQSYPYNYEQFQAIGYTATDSIFLTLDELLAPIPFKAKVFYPAMMAKIKEEIPPPYANKQVTSSERILTHYFQHNLQAVTSDSFERIELRWILYRADSPYQAYPLRLIDVRSVSLKSM